jgi:hypothetical protein
MNRILEIIIFFNLTKKKTIRPKIKIHQKNQIKISYYLIYSSNIIKKTNYFEISSNLKGNLVTS